MYTYAYTVKDLIFIRPSKSKEPSPQDPISLFPLGVGQEKVRTNFVRKEKSKLLSAKIPEILTNRLFK